VRFLQTRTSSDASYVDLHSHGGELSLEMALDVGDADLKQASLDQRGTDLLIEAPQDATGIEQRLAQLRERGYRITLTHPERCRQFQSDPEQLERLSDSGVLLALDAESLLGPARSAPRVLAERLCRSGHAHALAFDAAADQDASALAGAEAAAVPLVGAPRARWLVSLAPAAIVAGAELPPMPAAQAGDAPGAAGSTRAAAPEARLSLAVKLSRALILVPLVAVAVVSFVVIRSQHGSGATILTQQRYAQRLTARDVAQVVRTAPDPKTHENATHTRCVPRGIGDLKNPWRCQLAYANGDRLQYTVTIFGSGSYVGVNQVILGPGPRQSSPGTISGCCINIP
jgi:hypothetical protein